MLFFWKKMPIACFPASKHMFGEISWALKRLITMKKSPQCAIISKKTLFIRCTYISFIAPYLQADSFLYVCQLRDGILWPCYRGAPCEMLACPCVKRDVVFYMASATRTVVKFGWKGF